VTNQLTITLVVVFVGLAAIVMGAGLIWLIHDGVDNSALLAIPATLAGSALTGLVGLLASTRAGPPAPPQE